MLVTYRRRKPKDGGPPVVDARWEYGFQGTWRKEKRTFKSVQSMRGWFRTHFCGYWDVKFSELMNGSVVEPDINPMPSHLWANKKRGKKGE